MMDQTFRNARIVLPDEVVRGSLTLRDGRVHAVDSGASAVGEDVGGDLLVPGLVELHTDHLEAHYNPRPGVTWNSASSIQAYDAQIATAGITTVFDCFRVGADAVNGDFAAGEMRVLAGELVAAQAAGRLRAQHFIHLRCEVSAPGAVAEFETFTDLKELRLASLMDHAPGQRQFQTMDQYTLYYKTKRGLSEEEFQAFCTMRKQQSAQNSAPQRRAIAQLCRDKGITLASHDDATSDHVEEARGDGVRLAEFPTSVEAACASQAAGMSVLMGAPNVVRGGSHSGNIAAEALAAAGLLDVLSSDYIPFSLIHAPFVLVERIEALDLPAAMRMVTQVPAETVGLNDRGALLPGRRADVVRLSHEGGDAVPVVRAVWREGVRIA